MPNKKQETLYPHPYNKVGDGPEGPEVRYISDVINKSVKNNYITNILVEKGIKNKINGLNIIDKFLPLKVLSVSSKGKLLLIMCDMNVYIVNHMMLTGTWSNAYTNKKILEIKLLEKESWYYYDNSGFGTFDVYIEKLEFETKLKSQGPDLLYTALVNNGLETSNYNSVVSREYWLKEISLYKIRNKQIGKYLKECKRFSGIGVYLMCEILYKCKISPFRNLIDLSETEKNILYDSSLEIMLHIYLSYTNKEITPYTFKVYNNKLEMTGETVVKQLYNNQHIYWVPSIQK